VTLRGSILGIALVAIAANGARAQQVTPPLAEVARQAEAAKATVKKAKKVYTNANLASDPKSAPAPAPAAPAAAGPANITADKPTGAGQMVAANEATAQEPAVPQQSEER